MKPHEIRLIEEHEVLKEKITKLADFIERASDFDDLTKQERELLLEQFQHMMRYLQVLKIRLGLMKLKELEPQLFEGAAK